MAKITPILQAVTSGTHANELKKLLVIPNLNQVVGSVAFVQEAGVSCIAEQLKAVAKASTFYIGIRNDITSVQAVRRLLELGVKVVAVDTASRSILYHPKMFFVRTAKEAVAIIGSANLTFSGMNNNIEAGARIALNLEDADDKNFLETMVDNVCGLPAKHPDNVFQIKTLEAADDLFSQGRLIDEEIVVAPSVRSTAKPNKRDSIRAIKLYWHAPPTRKRRKVIVTPPPAPKNVAVAKTEEQPTPTEDFTLIWESKALTERDLNIPKHEGTHATGSMLWKKGAAENIDQRHFFKNEAFAGLDWQKDPKVQHYVRTHAKFQIVIKGVNCGTYDLKLSHNTLTNTKTYEQKNAMTQVHWGTALKIIAKRDLLGRTMSLYRKESQPPEFLIEID